MQQIILASSLLIFSLTATGAMYKWVDEDGVTQFTQTPPTGQKAETLRPPPPPAEDPATAQQRLQKQLDDFDNRRLMEQEQGKETRLAEENKALRKKNCAAARNNLQVLQAGGNRSMTTETGEVIRPTEEDRTARIEKAQQAIKDNCSPKD